MDTGIVIKSTGSWYTVNIDGQYFQCKIKGKFRQKGVKTTNPVTVGDRVDVQLIENDKTGLITAIHPRKNYIIRKATNLSRQAHILAANIDQALLITTLLAPKTLLTFVDRFLVTAEAYKIPAGIVFNKTDLYDQPLLAKIQHLSALYRSLGYEVVVCSALSGEGLADFSALLAGKTSMLLGNSGVGKSTLINKVDSQLDLKTSKISDYHQKGRHTTTFYEMFPLQTGGYIIDTPGIKSLGLVDIELEELAHYFPEFFERLSDCKYYNCSHTHEPDCAVKAALKAGDIAFSRYKSYLNMLEGEADKHREPE